MSGSNVKKTSRFALQSSIGKKNVHMNYFDHARLQAQLTHIKQLAKINSDEVTSLREQLGFTEPIVGNTLDEETILLQQESVTTKEKRNVHPPRRLIEETDEEFELVMPHDKAKKTPATKKKFTPPAADIAYIEHVCKDNIHSKPGYIKQIVVLMTNYFGRCRADNIDPYIYEGVEQVKIMKEMSNAAPWNPRKFQHFFHALENDVNQSI